MNHIQMIRPQDTSPPQIKAAIFDLIFKIVWPPEDGAAAPDMNGTLSGWEKDATTHFIICGAAATEILAHAMIFRREIFISNGMLAVGALAKVCVHPEARGRNFGADVVHAAFDYLPRLNVHVALFQTGVPRFYEKLGGRIISNRITHGADPRNPFWDSCEMIYPASFPWPEGDIDLGGLGY